MSQITAFTLGGGGGGGVLTLTGDSGGAISPVLGNINVFGGKNIVTSGAGNTLTVAETNYVLANNYSVANATPFVVPADAYYITVDTTTFAITIRLPDAPRLYQIFIIKDSGGQASIRNVTVTTVSGVKNIDAAPTFVMNTDYESINVLYDGFGYQIF